MIKYETPSYPVEARKNGIGGKVVVTVIIDEEGNVSTAKILSSDNIVFDEAALEAAKKSKFKPGEVDGVSVKVNMNIPYNFMLK